MKLNKTKQEGIDGNNGMMVGWSDCRLRAPFFE